MAIILNKYHGADEELYADAMAVFKSYQGDLNSVEEEVY